jgi:hypothetical protein
MTDAFERLRQALAERYRIHREIGHGGMATVYLADDVRLGRKVAVKVLRPEFAESLGTERFLREIGIAARLSHPNILPLHDSGEAEGFLYYVMPFIEGETVRDRLVSEKQLPVEDVVEITKEVSAALDYAHRQGVVHRDIKPENILIHEGKALVADFGIALAVSVAGGDRLTETGMVVGTPAYMSPEQSSGESHLDARSDIYSLATVVYEMLTGQPPFTGPTAQAIIARRLSETPPSIRVVRDGVSPGVEQVVHKALSRVPADRYKTAEEFAAELEKPAYVAPPKETRRWVGSAVATAAVVVLAAGGVWLLRGGEDSAVLALDPNLVAVVPFRVGSAEPEVRTWGQSMPDLFYLAYNGRVGLPLAADPGVIQRRWEDLGGAERQPTEEELEALAMGVGAGRLVTGALLGGPEQITLLATLKRVRGSETFRASVVGPEESIQSLVQQLAVDLAIADMGMSEDLRQARTAPVPLAALEAYLEGEAAFRRYREIGRFPAIGHFHRALDIDSTFAPAALALWEASRVACHISVPECQRGQDRGKRLMWEHRDRLNESDLAYVTMQREARQPGLPGSERLRVVMEAAEQWPNHTGMLHELTLRFYNNGPAAGLADWQERGFNAFDRIYSLSGRDGPDPGWEAGWPLEFSAGARDSARTRRYARLYVTDNDSVLSTSHFYAYSFLGDSAGLAMMWQRADEWCRAGGGGGFVRMGLPLDGWERCIDWFDSTRVTQQDRGRMLEARASLAYYQGREREAVAFMDTLRGEGLDRNGRMMVAPISNWVAGPGYDAAAHRAATVLDSIQAEFPDSRFGELIPYAGIWNTPHDRVCFSALWQVGAEVGDTARVRQTINWLESYAADRGRDPELDRCALLLEVLLEARDTTATGAPMLVYLDSIVPWVGSGGSLGYLINLVIARLWTSRGEWREALDAVDRTLGIWGTVHVPALRRIEGRAAAALGDTARAIRAYTHYLTLRTDPDPGPIREEWEQVRRELAALVGEGRQ